MEQQFNHNKFIKNERMFYFNFNFKKVTFNNLAMKL